MKDKIFYVFSSSLFILSVVLIGIFFVYINNKIENNENHNNLTLDTINDNIVELKETNKKLNALVPMSSIRMKEINVIDSFIKINNDTISDHLSFSIASIIVDVTSKFPNVSSFLAASLIRTESNFEKNSISWAGARGLCQIMPSTGIFLANVYNWTYYDSIYDDIEKNIMMGVYYLNHLIAMHSGDIELALSFYNGGGKNRTRYIYSRLPEEQLTESQIKQLSLHPKENYEYPKKIFGFLDTLKNMVI